MPHPKKYFILSLAILIIVFLIVVLMAVLSPQLKQVWQQKQGLKNFNKTVQLEEEKYKADTYGGLTPQETYQLFLQALQNKDIELASKYFILDKQSDYKKLFTQIQANGQWDNMMKDLLMPSNQQGQFLNDNWYQIEIVNEHNEVVATIALTKVKNLNFQSLSNIWKISQF